MLRKAENLTTRKVLRLFDSTLCLIESLPVPITCNCGFDSQSFHTKSLKKVFAISPLRT